MTYKRIKQLAEFFYSSDSAEDIPLRIAYTTGQYTGFDLFKEDFIQLFVILNRSDNLKEDLRAFVGQHHD